MEKPIFLNMTRAEVEADLARVRDEAAKSRREGYHLDAWAYSSYAEALEDALVGRKRCFGCGRVLQPAERKAR
jgi:uncharacterized membrane protein